MSERYQKIEADFKQLIDKKALFHAYVFFGEDEGAMLDFSQRLAHALERGTFERTERTLNDFLRIVPQERGGIGIGEVRAVHNFLYQRPVVSSKRMAVICPADGMSDEGQSALLKVIEESPNDVLVILIAKVSDSLMPTIMSRAHAIYFPAAERTVEVDDFFSETLGTLRKHLEKNSALAHEIVRRKMAMDRYNVNKPLQMRLLEGYAEQYGIAKKAKTAGGKRKTAKEKK